MPEDIESDDKHWQTDDEQSCASEHGQLLQMEDGEHGVDVDDEEDEEVLTKSWSVDNKPRSTYFVASSHSFDLEIT